MAGKTVVHRAAGTSGPTRIATGESRSLLDTPETHETYRGELTESFSAYGLLSINAARASIRQDGAMATIEITKKQIAVVVDVVEIDFNSAQREWWTAPYYADLNQFERVEILGKLRELEEYAATAITPAEINARHSGIIQELGITTLKAEAFDDIILNGDSYHALLPVITFTRSVAKNYGTPFIIADMGKIFSTAAMLSALPPVAQYQIAEITNTIAANSLQTLGWLKSGRYGQSSDGGVQYVQQYTFDSWPTNRYDFV